MVASYPFRHLSRRPRPPSNLSIESCWSGRYFRRRKHRCHRRRQRRRRVRATAHYLRPWKRSTLRQQSNGHSERNTTLHRSVFAVIATGLEKTSFCQPDADSPLKVPVASRVPRIRPQMSNVSSGVRGALVKTDSGDKTICVGRNLTPNFDGSRVPAVDGAWCGTVPDRARTGARRLE